MVTCDLPTSFENFCRAFVGSSLSSMALFATLTFMHVDKVNSGRKVINLFRVPKIGANFKIDFRNCCQIQNLAVGTIPKKKFKSK